MEFYQKLFSKCSCGQKPRPENRTIFVANQPPPNVVIVDPEKYPTNRVISSKYTAWNFLPKNLFEQFHRIANFYFLCVAIISFVIDTPVSPWTSLLPLIFVVVVTMVKQGYEDILRHRMDKEVNMREAEIVKAGVVTTVKSMDIQVGDIIKVTSNGGIPADMVMLSSHNPEGECYITTANLDGETSLKTFFCMPETRHLQSSEDFINFIAKIECQQPIEDLYKFVGVLNIYENNNTIYDNAEDISVKTKSLQAENVLLRGSRLKNTPFVYGCCVYTGQDTKISLNSRYKSHKYSRVEKQMNFFLIVFLIVLGVYSAIWTGLTVWYYSLPAHSTTNMWYVLPGTNTDVNALHIIEDFLAWMVLCNYIIPISMYVTVELQKFFGSIFFGWDMEMYDELTDEPAKANTSDLNEELGQVEYLFTDKTGTLTENDMQFRQCSVAGTKYVEVGGLLCYQPDVHGVQPAPVHQLPTEVKDLLLLLALCHTCRVDKKDGTAIGEFCQDGMDYEYQASSPDEKALLEACRRFGMVYHGVRDNRLEVSYLGDLQRFQLLHVLEFDPSRKRMSVIIEDEQGHVVMMTKGAESAILDRVVDGDAEQTERHVEEYAMLGLRTLVMAKKILSPEECDRFNDMLRNAKNALKDRDEKLAEAFDVVERGYTLLGVTAVEDRLQDGVPETITALREAGIKVWVLTGDKEETAVNISYSAGHFMRGMIEIRLTRQKTSEECLLNIEHFKQEMENSSQRGENKHALIVDGRSLAIAMQDHREDLRVVCQAAVTVLCCRMSPLQKAQVVRLIKESKENPTTAAVGDGANDVSMIQEAHVGLGVMGKEGRAAVRASDYAFGRFRFLRRALLVHGHYFYVRIAILVQYFFYKNVAMITAQLYYTFFSAFSAQSVFESMPLTLYNVTMTTLPVLIYGLMEKPVPQEILFHNSAFYKDIRHNSRLSSREFAKWNFLGLYQSLIFFFGCYFACGPQSPSSNGKMWGVYDFGALIMTVCVMTVNIKLMLVTYFWNWCIFFGFALTIVGYFLLTFMYSELKGLSWMFSEYQFYGDFAEILGCWSTWFTIILLCVAALIPDIMMRAYTDNFSELYRTIRQRKARVGPIETKRQSAKYDRSTDDVELTWEPWSTTNSCSNIAAG